MSHDISTLYTKYRNQRAGRRGYCLWKQEKQRNITPKDYGMFLRNHMKRGQRK